MFNRKDGAAGLASSSLSPTLPGPILAAPPPPLDVWVDVGSFGVDDAVREGFVQPWRMARFEACYQMRESSSSFQHSKYASDGEVIGLSMLYMMMMPVSRSSLGLLGRVLECAVRKLNGWTRCQSWSRHELHEVLLLQGRVESRS